MKIFSKEKEQEKPNRLVILIDYENISREASLHGKILDFEKIIEEGLNIGFIDFAFIFTPDHLVSYRMPPHLYDKGFYVIACPKGQKEKDKVDTIMTEIGIKLIDRSDITHIIIVSQDGDFVRLANYGKHHGKKVIAIVGEKISFLLKKVVDIIYPVPLKENDNGY